MPLGAGIICKTLRNRLLCLSRRSWQSWKVLRSLQSRWDTNVIATQAVFASPTHDQGFAMNLRKKNQRARNSSVHLHSASRRISMVTLNFIDLLPNNDLSGCVRRRPSFTSLGAKRKRLRNARLRTIAYLLPYS